MIRYKEVKCDFHLHTQYSDNLMKMTVAQYCKLARERGIDVIGIADHHNDLTPEKWASLQEDLDRSAGQGVYVIPGYEISFMDGHMVVMGKDQYDCETIMDSFREMTDEGNVRIIAHPDNNEFAWRMNLLPGIDGLELANSGHDILSYEQDSECNGLRTYKEYLLLRHPIAPFGQSDCHGDISFGMVWTRILIPSDQEVTRDSIRGAIKAGHCYAGVGQIDMEFYTDEGHIMGDAFRTDGNGEIHWKAAEGSEITFFYGDMELDKYTKSEGSFRPYMNGPYWMMARKGSSWGVSAPIWVEGITEDRPVHEKKVKKLLSNGIIQDLKARLEKLIGILRSIQDKYYPDRKYITMYIQWLEGLLPQNIPAREAANKSFQLMLYENRRQLHGAIRIIRRLISDLLDEAVTRDGSVGHNEVRIYNFSGKPLDHIMKLDIALPKGVTDFYLTTDKGAEIDFVSYPKPVKDIANGFRSGKGMLTLMPWLMLAEVMEYKITKVDFREEGDTLYVKMETAPWRFVDQDICWEKEADWIREAVEQERYARYHLTIERMDFYSLQIDTTGIGESDSIKICYGTGQTEETKRVSKLYSNFRNDQEAQEYIFLAQAYKAL
ncbi:MAG: CehA/McbA family metallohydrolase [Clostridia bacterium]